MRYAKPQFNWAVGMKIMLWVALALLVLFVVVMAYRVSSTPASDAFGKGLAITACGSKPNCVASLAGPAARSAAAFTFADELSVAQQRLKRALLSEPRASIVNEQPGYIAVTFRSALFGFPDDAEFYLDAASLEVRFRSAARIGYSDMGVNAKRIERLRAQFALN